MDNAPWYRHVWVWLIMLPPLAAVISGVGLVIIAHHGADEVLRRDVVKVGVTYQEDTRKRDAAAALGLDATVHLVRESGRITVLLRGDDEVRPETLTLRLVHPTDSRHDRSLELQRVDNIYRVDLGQETLGRWNVQLEPTDQAWRLDGELGAEASAVNLDTGS